MAVAEVHPVLGTPLVGRGLRVMKSFILRWDASGVPIASCGKFRACIQLLCGYMGGWTPNPTYEETCTSRTGHTEIVMVVFDPNVEDIETLLAAFWENHDPTTANRQGNDIGTQYRSAIYTTTPGQLAAVGASRDQYQASLSQSGFGTIMTQICDSSSWRRGVLLRRGLPPGLPSQVPRWILQSRSAMAYVTP